MREQTRSEYNLVVSCQPCKTETGRQPYNTDNREMIAW